MPIKKRLPFAIGWLLINLVGGAAAGILESRLQFLGTLILAGIPMALVQGLYLHHYLPHRLPGAWQWTFLMAIGWPLAHLLTISNQSWLTPLVTVLTIHSPLWEVFWINFIRLGVVMLLIGIAQWIILLRGYRGSQRWPLVSLIGGALLGGAGATLCRIGCDQLNQIGGPWLVGTLLGALGWGAYALVTGPVLTHLLNNVVPVPVRPVK